MAGNRGEVRGDRLRAQWRDRLRRFDKREGTVAAFCEAESVPMWALYDWRRKLMACEAGDGDGDGGTAPPFVEVGSMRLAAADPGDESPRATLPAGIELRIDLGGGLVLQIVRR